MKRISVLASFLLICSVSYAQDINTFPDDPPAMGVNHLARYNVTEERGIYVLPAGEQFGVIQQKNFDGFTRDMYRGGIYVRIEKSCENRITPSGLFIGRATEDLMGSVPFGIELPPSVGQGIIVAGGDSGISDTAMVEICVEGEGEDFWFDANLPAVPLKK